MFVSEYEGCRGEQAAEGGGSRQTNQGAVQVVKAWESDDVRREKAPAWSKEPYSGARFDRLADRNVEVKEGESEGNRDGESWMRHREGWIDWTMAF